MVYYIIVGVFFILCMCNVISKFKTIYLEFLLLIVLIFLSAFRSHEVGADTLVYLMFFEKIPSLLNFNSDIFSHIEIGFRVFIAAIKTFTSSNEFFLFLCTVICFLPMYVGLKKLRLPYILIGLFFYFLIFYINYPNSVIRQGISMSLFILSLPYMLKRDTSKVLILSFISFLFHSTGFIVLLCYIFVSLSYRRAFLITIFFSILSIILYKFGALQYLIFNYWKPDYEQVYTETFVESTSFFQYLYRVIIVFLIGFFILKVNNEFYKKIFLFYVIGFLIYISLSDNNLLAARFNMFFRILEVALIPYVLSCVVGFKSRAFVFFIFFIVFFAFFVQAENIPYNQYSFNSDYF